MLNLCGKHYEMKIVTKICVMWIRVNRWCSDRYKVVRKLQIKQTLHFAIVRFKGWTVVVCNKYQWISWKEYRMKERYRKRYSLKIRSWCLVLSKVFDMSDIITKNTDISKIGWTKVEAKKKKSSNLASCNQITSKRFILFNLFRIIWFYCIIRLKIESIYR